MGRFDQLLDGSGFRPSYFPKKEMRRDVRRSVAFVVVAGGTYLATLTYFTGWQGLLLYFVAPWFAIHAWFSITTLMHHSSEDIPYLPEKYWTRNASRLLVTTDYAYPRWLLLLTHNISLHTAHHVATAVPFYNLGKAQAALKRQYPDLVRVEKASVPRLWNILRKCRFYDLSRVCTRHVPMQRADSEKQAQRDWPHCWHGAGTCASDHAASRGIRAHRRCSSTPANPELPG